MRTLTRYIGRDVLLSTLLLFVSLLGLFTFFDLIAEMRDVGRGGYTLGSALLFVALHAFGVVGKSSLSWQPAQTDWYTRPRRSKRLVPPSTCSGLTLPM